ncbi:MAG: thioredoxin fold domain-containing protein [Candidatus Marinimicrobia bacterium]|nr:thioredoxin fold domain-containing protein [Candidatus Neomarinimicrobiota bacterium]
MKIQKLSLLALILVFSFLIAKESESNWFKFDNGVAQSNKTEKPVLIDFYTDWCHWCDVMDEKTFSNPEVEEYLDNNFVKIRVNAEDKNTSHSFQGNNYNSVELARAFNVTGYPSIAFLDNNQQVITVIPGYIPADKFIKVLEYIEQECYKKQVSFEEYLNKGCEEEG